MFPQGNPSPGTSALNQQNIQLLGNAPFQQAASPMMPTSGSFNTTAPQSSNGVASMIKALKGGAQ